MDPEIEANAFVRLMDETRELAREYLREKGFEMENTDFRRLVSQVESIVLYDGVKQLLRKEFVDMMKETLEKRLGPDICDRLGEYVYGKQVKVLGHLPDKLVKGCLAVASKYN